MGSTEPLNELARARRLMVDAQLAERGIEDPRVLEAMAAVPRDRFVPADVAAEAHEDRALPIGKGQTISQPYMVARACELAALSPGQRALDVGAGSGYQAAVLARLCARVIAIELVPALAARARQTLAELTVENVRVVVGDGTLGFAEEAPYDAIVVAAAGPEVPPALIEQLAPGGRLVMPLGPSLRQELTVLHKSARGALQRRVYDACRYVPLRGAGGWTDRVR